MSLAELTSLDELLFQMMQRGYFTSELVSVLWAYYGTLAKATRGRTGRTGRTG